MVYITYKFKDTSDYGTFSELYTYSGVLLALMVFRLDTAFFRFGAKKESKDTVFSTSFVLLLSISTFISTLIFFNAEWLSRLIDYQGFIYYIQWFAWILWFDAITALIFARFRLDSRPIRFMFYKIANVLLTIFFILFILEILPRIDSEMYQNISNLLGVKKEIDYVFFANLLASGIVFFMLIPEFLKYKFNFDRSIISKMFKYSIPLVIVGIASVINQSGAAIFLKYLLGGDYNANKEISGVYMAAMKLALLLNLFTVAFNYAAEPFFFNQHASNPDKKEIYGQVAFAYTLVGGIVVIATYFSLDGLALLLGENYRNGIEIVPYLLLGFYFLGLYYNFSIWYKLSDNTIYGAIISIIAMFVTFSLSFWLIPSIGQFGAAIAALACYTVMAFLGYAIGQKKYPIPYPIYDILKNIVLVILLMIASYFLRISIENNVLLTLIHFLLLMLYLCYLYVSNKSFITSLK
jgi:O-antigen/teichoic acid export membrane protein